MEGLKTNGEIKISISRAILRLNELSELPQINLLNVLLKELSKELLRKYVIIT